MTEIVQALEDTAVSSMSVVGVQIHCTLLHSVFFENCTDEHARKATLETHALRIQTGQ